MNKSQDHIKGMIESVNNNGEYLNLVMSKISHDHI